MAGATHALIYASSMKIESSKLTQLGMNLMLEGSTGKFSVSESFQIDTQIGRREKHLRYFWEVKFILAVLTTLI